VAEIVLGTFCVTAPNVNVCVLATLMAAFTIAVALTVAVSDVCAPETLGSANATHRTAFSNRWPTETLLARGDFILSDKITESAYGKQYMFNYSTVSKVI